LREAVRGPMRTCETARRRKGNDEGESRGGSGSTRARPREGEGARARRHEEDGEDEGEGEVRARARATGDGDGQHWCRTLFTRSHTPMTDLWLVEILPLRISILLTRTSSKESCPATSGTFRVVGLLTGVRLRTVPYTILVLDMN